MEFIVVGDILIIMVGVGVCVVNLLLFLQVGVKEVYSLVGYWLLLEMCFCYLGVLMLVDFDVDEYRCYVVNGVVVVEMKRIIFVWRS